MKKHILTFLFIPCITLAQVGIGTTTPEETLHVEGTMRITNTKTTIPAKIGGLNDSGTVNEIIVGDNLSLDGNRLNAIIPNTTNSGASTYGITTINMPNNSVNEKFDNLDLGLNSTNSDKILFKLEGRTANYRITGIAGGTDGRKIILVNISTSNLRFMDENSNSQAANRLTILSNNIATSGQGTAEFIYDGGLQRWILVKFRD